MIEKPKVLKCTLKVLENLSTFEMYLSTSTSTEDFPEMYLSTLQVLYKLYLSTKYSCPALPGGREFNPRPGKYSGMSFSSDQVTGKVFSSEHAFPSKF